MSGYIGNAPTAVPLTSADIADGIITSAKIADGSIVNADINASAGIVTSKLSGSLGSFVFLGETTGTGVASIDLNGYFTSDYDYYKIFLDGINGSVNDQRLFMRFSTTGSYTVQTTNYYYSSAVSYRTSATNATYAAGEFNDTRVVPIEYLSSTTSQPSYAELTLYNPLSTSLTKGFNCIFHTAIGNLTDTRNGVSGGLWNDTTAITGLRIYMESGNVSARKIKIYGVKNS